MNDLSFFENIKLYVGFTDASSAALRELRPIAQPFFKPIIDDFYATFRMIAMGLHTEFASRAQ